MNNQNITLESAKFQLSKKLSSIDYLGYIIRVEKAVGIIEDSLIVYVTNKTKKLITMIPVTFHGYKVRVVVQQRVASNK